MRSPARTTGRVRIAGARFSGRVFGRRPLHAFFATGGCGRSRRIRRSDCAPHSRCRTRRTPRSTPGVYHARDKRLSPSRKTLMKARQIVTLRRYALWKAYSRTRYYRRRRTALTATTHAPAFPYSGTDTTRYGTMYPLSMCSGHRGCYFSATGTRTVHNYYSHVCCRGRAY